MATKQATTARVKMLGNHLTYEVGKVYDLPVDTANQLTGLGVATALEPATAQGEED